MREVQIVYGDKLIPVRLPEPVLTAATEFRPRKIEAISDIRQALKDVMAAPIGTT